MLVITPDNPQYSVNSSNYGTYYVRIRPSYNLASVITTQNYSLNFYVFS